jgi:hypothetical protein
MKRKYNVLILLLSGIIFSADRLDSIDIIAPGNWSSLTITSADLIAGAGSDLESDYESDASVVFISISGTTGSSDNWRVDVKKIDTNWDISIKLYIRRTSDGNGSGIISVGTSYQEVTEIYQSFFNGSGERSNIDMQLKISGVSIQIPPDNFTLTIYYNIVDTI